MGVEKRKYFLRIYLKGEWILGKKIGCKISHEVC
jgi:hypothetical protein